MKKELLKFLVLAMLAVGAGPVSAAVWSWSRTASSNATADSTINWAEGMSPSSVNDSARSMMARLADYRDDISGSLLTAGTSTAYTLTSHQTFDTLAHMDGAAVAFTAHATNGATPTLAVDGLAARGLVSASGVVIPAGTLIANTPYVATYNNANSEFRLQGFYGSAYNVPLGGILASTLATAPNSNFVLAAGQCLSTTTYATYWVAFGSPGVGPCAAGQFQVFDLRGRTLSGLDNLGGSAANRMTNSASGCGVAFTSIGVTCGSESQTLTSAQIPAVAFSGTTAAQNVNHSHTYLAPTNTAGITGGGAFAADTGNGTLTNSGIESANHTHSYSGNIAGGGGAHPIVMPTVAITYLIRVI